MNTPLQLALCFGLLMAPALPAAPNPFEQAADESYTGRFVAQDVALRLKPVAGKWAGTIIFKGKHSTVRANNHDGQLEGTFGDADQAQPFSARSEDDGLTFIAGSFTSKLQRQKLPQLAGP